jgi:diacylglycerol O-acyltransferase / wax synthase
MERLTAQDLSSIWPEEFGWPQDIGALAILNGDELLDRNGRFRIEHVRDWIGRRVHLVHEFRQILYMPRKGLGWPLWVDAPSFDVVQHVRVLPLEPPGGEPQLLAACERLRRRPLDRSRPLWGVWFLPGLPGRRIGLFMKLHHAVADGVAGVAAFGALLDFTPDALSPSAPPWTPAPIPTARELFADNWRRRAEALDGFLSSVGHPVEAARRAKRAWPWVRENLGTGAPRTSINRRVGPDRRLALVRSRLDLVKEAAHAHGGKVNDILLAALAGGLRDLLRSRGEPTEGLFLRVFVPVSLHPEEPGRATGNMDGAMVVPVPVGEPDPVRRLRTIAVETAERKRNPPPAAGTLFRNGVVQRAFLRLLPYQRIMNVYAANVPGPPVPMYLAGARLLEVFPIVPIMGNDTIGVGALSYDGQFNLTVVADRDACPDMEVLVEGTRSSLPALARAVSVDDHELIATAPGVPTR